ncbi:ychF, partial [Symbiodinium microadriaticum]
MLCLQRCLASSRNALFNRSLQTGIVGLPNVGKSTLFNALVGDMQAEAANYPFCTIEPNVGLVSVPDPRLQILGDINKSVKVLPTIMEFVDIAGIIKGASEGAGLGNKFLANIRNTDAIVQVVRCFEDSNVIHVDETVNPLRDIEVIDLELALADLAQVEKRLAKCQKDKASHGDEISVLTKIREKLDAGLPARSVPLTRQEQQLVKGHMLLTMKKVIYAANVSDADLAAGNDMSRLVRKHAEQDGSEFVLVSAQVESELAGFSLEERGDFLDQLGVTDDTCGLK